MRTEPTKRRRKPIRSDIAGLYYLNSRYYDASVCRFLSPDSAGILEALAAAFTMVPPPVAKGTANDTTSAASPAQAQGFAILVHNADYDAIAKLKSDENQQTIVKWAKEYKKTGISMDDAEALVDLAKQYNYNGLLGNPRIDLVHKGRRGFFSNRPHVHIGPINHIKIIG